MGGGHFSATNNILLVTHSQLNELTLELITTDFQTQQKPILLCTKHKPHQNTCLLAPSCAMTDIVIVVSNLRVMGSSVHTFTAPVLYKV